VCYGLPFSVRGGVSSNIAMRHLRYNIILIYYKSAIVYKLNRMRIGPFFYRFRSLFSCASILEGGSSRVLWFTLFGKRGGFLEYCNAPLKI
jgi:hypothetical protein